jgi:hypothetical protein
MLRPMLLSVRAIRPMQESWQQEGERAMKHHGFIIAIAFAVIVMTSSAALAANLCITQGANIFLAGRKFTLPGKNTCKPVGGFNSSNVCSGVACTAADGGSVRIHLTCSEDQVAAMKSFYFRFPLPLPSTAGSATYSYVDNGSPGGVILPAATYQLAPCAKPYSSVP